jgi:hypothetical protein
LKEEIIVGEEGMQEDITTIDTTMIPNKGALPL